MHGGFTLDTVASWHPVLGSCFVIRELQVLPVQSTEPAVI